jgi:hypothetical protein
MIADRRVASDQLVLMQALPHRRRAARRRAMALVGAVSLAAAGWTAGALLAPSDSAASALGPFSYFPS